MKRITQIAFIASLSLFTTILAGTALAENQIQLYDELLHQYVKNGQVDYTGLKKKEAQLDIYLEYLAATDPAQMPENDRFAFYINAYNAYTIKLILKNFKRANHLPRSRILAAFFLNPGPSSLLR